MLQCLFYRPTYFATFNHTSLYPPITLRIFIKYRRHYAYCDVSGIIIVLILNLQFLYQLTLCLR